MQQAIQGLGEKSKELEQEIQVLLQEIDESRKKKEEMMESQKDFFEKRDKLMEHMNELNKENFRLESRKNNLEEKLEGKINYMWNEYELTYRNAMEYEVDESVSYTRMKANVSDTRTKIKRLGDVNVNAIEDYKNVSERYELLKGQHDDLIESEKALMKIIGDLDEEMRKQFTEKFAEIQQQFDKVFKELFGRRKRNTGTGGGRGCVRCRYYDQCPAAGKEIRQYDAAFRWRKGTDCHCAFVCHPESEAVTILSAG